MIRVCSLLLLVWTVPSALGQTAAYGPLGVLISPPQKIQLPAELRPAVPRRSVVRLIESTQLSVTGETIVVYDNGNQYEPRAHVAVIKDGKRVADFGLVALFAKEQVGESYALFKAAQIPTVGAQAFATAFRNIGDGAGTLLVLLTAKDGEYKVWKRGITQGQVRVRKGGSIEVWGAEGDGNCVWCPQHYKVTTFDWKDGTLSEVHHYETKHALNPGPISENPIVIEP